MSATDTATQVIAAGGSGGFLFIVARWLWHYEQVVTTRYEHQIRTKDETIDTLQRELDSERSARMAAEQEQSRLIRALVVNGIDHRNLGEK